MFNIGPYSIDSQVVLAPMAGITDQPFRHLCRQHGAGMTPSEMITADKRLWDSRKSRQRLNHNGEPEPRIIQIAGGDPQMLAEAARLNADNGAQIIDINMGCPAKKVCNKAAGSALLRDESLVQEILESVVSAVSIPVTLKIRTGWNTDQRNGLRIARIAEQSGIAALAVHGRTRACGFRGEAEYATIAEIRQQISIPLIANGDIDSADKAQQVLAFTGADAVMIGRAAQGKPWIFAQIDHFLKTGERLAPPASETIQAIIESHLQGLYGFYGDYLGVRIARKHVGWYVAALLGSHAPKTFRAQFNTLEHPHQQLSAISDFFVHYRLTIQAA